MVRIINKVTNFIFNKLEEYQQERKFRLRQRKVAELKRNQKSDLNRWEDDKELLVNWNERTKILATMIPANSDVIEFGAGNQNLKNYLSENCTYQPSDLVSRSEQTLICDLNKPININLKTYDTAVFSGVLEYVYDIDKVFEQLNGEINRVVLSYACKDSFTENRERLGWLSDFKKEELEKIFKKYQYNIKEYQEWRSQSIFKLEKDWEVK